MISAVCFLGLGLFVVVLRVPLFFRSDRTGGFASLSCVVGLFDWVVWTYGCSLSLLFLLSYLLLWRYAEFSLSSFYLVVFVPSVYCADLSILCVGLVSACK